MNAMPKKFMLILMDLGLSLLFLVIILIAVADFNSRIKREEQQAQQGTSGTSTTPPLGTLTTLKKQTDALAAQIEKNRSELQQMWDKNAILTAEIRKKNAEARQLLEDNSELASQNAALLVRLNKMEDGPAIALGLPLPLPAMAPPGLPAITASLAPTLPSGSLASPGAESLARGGSDAVTQPSNPSAQTQEAWKETLKAQALRRENAQLTEQLAQLNVALQDLYQQQAATDTAPPHTTPDDTIHTTRRMTGPMDEPIRPPETASTPATVAAAPSTYEPPHVTATDIPGIIRPEPATGATPSETSTVPSSPTEKVASPEPESDGIWGRVLAYFDSPERATQAPDPQETTPAPEHATTQETQQNGAPLPGFPERQETLARTITPTPVETPTAEETGIPTPLLTHTAPDAMPPLTGAERTPPAIMPRLRVQETTVAALSSAGQEQTTPEAQPSATARETTHEALPPASRETERDALTTTREALPSITRETASDALATTRETVPPATRETEGDTLPASGAGEKPSPSLTTAPTQQAADAATPSPTGTPEIPAEEPEEQGFWGRMVASLWGTSSTPDDTKTDTTGPSDSEAPESPKPPGPATRGTRTHTPPTSAGMSAWDQAPSTQIGTAASMPYAQPQIDGVPLVDITPVKKTSLARAAQTLRPDAMPPQDTAAARASVTDQAPTPPRTPDIPKDPGMSPEQASIALTPNTRGSEGPHLVALSAEDIAEARRQLMINIRRDLETQGIPVQVDHEAGTLYLPGLLDFQSDNTTALQRKKSQHMRTLANTLAQRLFCFSRDANLAEECANIAGAFKLDALVIVGNAGPAPVGTRTFRRSWEQANTRALKTFETLLKSHPRINGLRNNYDQSIFRLDGFLPPRTTGKPRPTRRVELRFIMDTSAIKTSARP